MTSPKVYMPRVDELPPDRLAHIFKHAHLVSLAEVEVSGHVAGQYYVALLTPGRMVRTIPAPPPNTMAQSQVQSILSLLPLPRKRVVAIAFMANALEADIKQLSATIPFMGFLLGFAYVGHSVVLFEGHPSAFESGVQGVDMLLVDHEITSLLPIGWTEIAFRVMRTPEVNVYNSHNPQSSLVQRIVNPTNNIYYRVTSSSASTAESSQPQPAPIDVMPAAVPAEPTTVDELVKRAQEYSRQLDFPSALNDVNHALELEPDNTKLYVLRAAVHKLKGDLNAALQDMTQAIELEPAGAQHYLARSEIYFSLKDGENAVKDCDDAIRLDPNNAIAFHRRAFTKYFKRDFAGAIPDALQALRIDPEWFWAYQDLAGARLEIGDYKSALSDIEAGLNLAQSLQSQQKIGALHYQAFTGRLKYLQKRVLERLSQ